MTIQEARNRHVVTVYLIEQLTLGTTLAKVVLERVNLSLGGFRIAAPTPIDWSQPVDLEHSTDLTGDEEMGLAKIIKSFIRIQHCGVLLQDVNMGPDQLPDTESPARALVYRNEIYWSVAGAALAEIPDDTMLRKVVWHTSQFPLTAFFYRDEQPLTESTLTHADLERIATELIGVAVSVFDFRSFLIWWRDDLISFTTLIPEK